VLRDARRQRVREQARRRGNDEDAVVAPARIDVGDKGRRVDRNAGNGVGKSHAVPVSTDALRRSQRNGH